MLPVAEALERSLGASQVFYDDWYESYIAGDDADVVLQGIYDRRCVLAVVCVSARYGGKPWTLAEHAAIRSRAMRARVSGDRLCVLPVRVGDGEIKEIPFNTIVPDIRPSCRSIEDAARLILDRLRHIDPSLVTAGTDDLVWPPILDLDWPLADHTEACAAFGELVTGAAPFRLLPLKGPSEVGKSHVTRLMRDNALTAGLACGRFDFKGGTSLEKEAASFADALGVENPAEIIDLDERMRRIFRGLQQRGSPTLLIFDTYEDAGAMRRWFEEYLLPGLPRFDWLRVVVAGQETPGVESAGWRRVSSKVIILKRPGPIDWYEFVKGRRSDVTLADVETIHRICAGKPSTLASALAASG